MGDHRTPTKAEMILTSDCRDGGRRTDDRGGLGTRRIGPRPASQGQIYGPWKKGRKEVKNMKGKTARGDSGPQSKLSDCRKRKVGWGVGRGINTGALLDLRARGGREHGKEKQLYTLMYPWSAVRRRTYYFQAWA